MGAGHAHRFSIEGDSLIHRLAPEVKIVATFAFVLAVAITPRRSVAAFLVDAVMIGVCLGAARVSARQFLARLTVILPFVAFAFFVPFVAGGPTTKIGGVSLSVEGLWGTWNILAKSALGASASLLLAGTTPVPDILRGLTRLRVPPLLTSIVAFMFRYLDVIGAEMAQMRVAMTSRGHDPRWLWQIRPVASASGALFVRSYERGERVHGAMLARGFTGTMPTESQTRPARSQWAVAALLPAVAALGAVAGLASGTVR